MKIGFWNINGQCSDEIQNLICDFAHVNGIDLLVLFESALEPLDVLAELNARSLVFYFYKPLVSDFVQIYTKFSPFLLREVKDHNRITCKEYHSPFDIRVNFVLLHFPARLFYDEADQNAMMMEVNKFIMEIEQANKNENTILLGDFNMDPFQASTWQLL